MLTVDPVIATLLDSARWASQTCSRNVASASIPETAAIGAS